MQDHPRARGEYPAYGVMVEPDEGSPPSARGILPRFRVNLCPSRITPERAGNTQAVTRSCWPGVDYPRARGEYAVVRVQRGTSRGSPPSARGIPTGGMSGQSTPGITPERAGNTRKGREWARLT